MSVVDRSAPLTRMPLNAYQARDPSARLRYLQAAWADVPRLLGAIDRNPYRATYGCLDREFWHYRTSSFPSRMYQEGVLPLAMLCTTDLPGNRWHQSERVRELAWGALRFAARSSHADGSCDDYYPYERALGAAVFSLQAAARALELLQHESHADQAEIMAWLQRAATWIARHDESGRLTNHHALAALALERCARLLGTDALHVAARRKLQQVLEWQHAEGWFNEYGGADPGYQTVTIDCLAKLWRLNGDDALLEPLNRALRFSRHFLHPDGSYAGEYGSRGTYHCYPHGLELCAAHNADAADLADGVLQSLATGTDANFADDRMYLHRLANWLEAFGDWSPRRPTMNVDDGDSSTRTAHFPAAGLLVARGSDQHTVISTARGGICKHFGRAADESLLLKVNDAGLILETTTGQIAVSQQHHHQRTVTVDTAYNGAIRAITVEGPLDWARFETMTSIKQALLQLGMISVGRFCRTLVRRLLQRRLITGRRACPIVLTRTFELLPAATATDGSPAPQLRITDQIRLLSDRINVRRMSIGSDHQSSYVAASGVYQEAVLFPWQNLDAHLEPLNARRMVTIVREA